MSEAPPISPSPRDSQQQLAMSIARAVQLGLPEPDSEEAIRESVREALKSEARNNECALAQLRVVVLAVFAALATGAFLWPAGFAFADYPLWPAALTSLAALGSAALYLRLRSDWYPLGFRRYAPAVDAALILGGGLIHLAGLGEARGAATGGFFAVVVIASAFVAFSGALRLSRRAALVGAVSGALAWFLLALLARVPWLTILLVAMGIATIGYLGTRVTRIVRRVIVDEVTRLRLARLYQDAREAIDAREEVLKIVSHDLRNPLGTIAMAADLLLDLPTDERLKAQQLGIIKRAGDRMNRLIHDLLDVARMEAGRLPIEPETVEVDSLFESVVEMMRPLAEDKELRLLASVPARLPPVHVDPERTIQVFSNLVGNAIKFTPAGGAVTLGAERAGEKVRMSVSDTGPGIPPEQLEEIFGRMWQARRDDRRGIGLGLTIARSIVEAHGERIGVESRLGEGTTFWFTTAVARQRR